MPNNKPVAPEYVRRAVVMGHKWECSCGELYRSFDAARICRKCRDYLVNPSDWREPVDASEAYDLS